MVRTCPHCGCSEIDEDSARGDATCTGCGTVLEESIVVSENQFAERAGGTGHTLVGQFVSMDRAQPSTLVGVPGLPGQESREVTYYKGKKLIEEIASQLRINQHCMDTAYNFFKMCVSRNLTRGRTRSHVVAALLYMTCRLENTAHLLLDFSDITQVNVFDLGRTLNFLSRSLRINLPTTDPCLYILRFACLLDFGDKQKEVVTLATRLVQRMKRDWMATGRRPTGLCGAALLLAARSYNFNRTIGDVVRVVHVSETVVRKRLDEFSQTPSAALTIDEFATIDLDHSEDPPAFREARRKAREAQKKAEEDAAEKMAAEVQTMEEAVEKELEKKRRDKFKKSSYAKMMAGNLDDPDMAAAETMVRNEIVESAFAIADGEPSTSSQSHAQQYGPSLESLGIRKTEPGTHNGAAAAYAHGVLQEVRGALAGRPLPAQDRDDGELDLTGIDDTEMDTYILTDRESKLKEDFWMRINGEHVKEVERKRKEREEQDELDKNQPGAKKARKRSVRRKEPIQAATASEAIEKIIHEKKLSNKINYDILKEMEGVDPLKPLAHSLLSPGSQPTASQIVDTVNALVRPKLEPRADTPDLTREFPLAGSSQRKSVQSRRRLQVKPNLNNLNAVKTCLSLQGSPAAAEKRPAGASAHVENGDGVQEQVDKTNGVEEVQKEVEQPAVSEAGSVVDVKPPQAPLVRTRYQRARPNIGKAAAAVPAVKTAKKERMSMEPEGAGQSQPQTSKEQEKEQEDELETESTATETPADVPAEATPTPKAPTRGRRVAAKPNIGGKATPKASPAPAAAATPVPTPEKADEKGAANGGEALKTEEKPATPATRTRYARAKPNIGAAAKKKCACIADDPPEDAIEIRRGDTVRKKEMAVLQQKFNVFGRIAI